MALPPAALAAVLAALAAGFSRNRLWPVAGFLAVAAVASTYVWTSSRLTFRRAHQQQQTGVAWNVRLTKPFWIGLGDALTLLFPGAVLGAVAAAVGFPGIGAGAFLTFAALASWIPNADFGMTARGLTFESAGLRVHIRGATFVVPWTSIVSVERIGPQHFQVIRLRLREPQAIVASLLPDVPKVRARVETFVHAGDHEGQLMFLPWTAGLDGASLGRTIDAAVAGTIGQVN